MQNKSKLLSTCLTLDCSYLLGAGADGYIYAWPFKNLLLENLKAKGNNDTAFVYTARIKVLDGPINDLRITVQEKQLFVRGENLVKQYAWNVLADELSNCEKYEIPQVDAPSMTNKAERVYSLHHALKVEEDRFPVVSALGIDDKGKKLVLGSKGGDLFVFDTVTGKLESEISTGCHSPINKIEIVDTGRAVITFVAGEIHQWDILQKNKILEYKIEEKLGPIVSLAVDKDQRWLLVAHEDFITRWNKDLGILAGAMPTALPAKALVYGENIYSGHEDGKICKWNWKDELLCTMDASSTRINDLTLIEDEGQDILIATGNTISIDVFLKSTRLFSYTL